MKSVTMTIRLGADMKFRLERIAELNHRSKSYIAAEAINDYLKLHEWQLEEINQGIIEADLGKIEDHSKILAIWKKNSK
jgi:predicted transcriptional regulator